MYIVVQFISKTTNMVISCRCFAEGHENPHFLQHDERGTVPKHLTYFKINCFCCILKLPTVIRRIKELK